MENDAPKAIKQALVRLIISQSATEQVDQEDRDMLERYALGEVSREELDAFFLRKASRIEAQIHRPQ